MCSYFWTNICFAYFARNVPYPHQLFFGFAQFQTCASLISCSLMLHLKFLYHTCIQANRKTQHTTHTQPTHSPQLMITQWEHGTFATVYSMLLISGHSLKLALPLSPVLCCKQSKQTAGSMYKVWKTYISHVLWLFYQLAFSINHFHTICTITDISSPTGMMEMMPMLPCW